MTDGSHYEFNLFRDTDVKALPAKNERYNGKSVDSLLESCVKAQGDKRQTLITFPLKSVGISNQMHGIVYIDECGKAVSPLITWQDGRGNLQRKTHSYASELSAITGCKVATGYGVVTLFYDGENSEIPRKSHKICTIGDYVAYRLCGEKTPVTHESNAHSMGLYDVRNHCWNRQAIDDAGLNYSLFPKVCREVAAYGKAENGASVYIAVGDNQASVYGVERGEDTVTVNI